MNKTFSIIVPIYNTEQYIKECIDSIINQSFTNFELILVNDGSTDKCPQICNYYEKIDSRIKVFHKKNEGLVAARKSGFELSSGEYIVSVDSDDYLDKTLLSKLYEIIKKFDVDAISYGCTKFTNFSFNILSQNIVEGYYSGSELIKIRENFIFDKEKGNLNWGAISYGVCTKCVKHELFKQSIADVPQNITKGEDLLFTSFLISKCSSFYVLNNNGYFYRYNNTSMTNNYNIDDFDNTINLIDIIITNCIDIKNIYSQISVYAVNMFLSICNGLSHKNKLSVFCKTLSYYYSSYFKQYFKIASSTKMVHRNRIKILLPKLHLWPILYYVFRIKDKI